MKTTLLIEHYTNHLSFYHLVFKKNNAFKNVTLFILSITNLIILAYFLYTNNYFGIIVTSLFFVLIGLLGRYFNVKTIKKLYSKEINTNKFSWDTIGFDRMVISKIEKYLIDAKLQDRLSLELVIKVMEEKINEIKVRTYGVYSVIGVILLPIWNNIVSKNISEVNDVKTYVIFLMMSCIIIYIVLMVKNLAGSLNIRLSQMKELKLFLQEILIDKI